MAILAPTPYATLADVYNLGVPAGAVSQVLVPTQQAALDAANMEADSYLAGRFRLPITSWGMDIKLHVCARAAFTILVVRGYNPDDDADENIKSRSDAAQKWLQGIADGEITPTLIDSSTVQGDTGSPFTQQATVTSAGSGGYANQLVSMNGGPPTVTQTSVGFVNVGSPGLRGW